MRVVELSQRFPPAIGGVEATLAELVRALRGEGIDVDVLTTDLERVRPFRHLDQDASAPRDGVHRYRAYRTLPLPLGLGVVSPGMLAAALSTRADVLHAHAFGYWPTWVVELARRRRRLPVAITPHLDPGRHRVFSGLYHHLVARGTLRRADRIIAQSGVEEELLLRLGADPAVLVRIPTGIALDEFRPPRTVRSGATIRLLTVGRLDLEQKGLTTLVRAFASIAPRRPVELHVVGDDWGAARPLASLAGELGVADRVRVSASVSRGEVLAAYGAADLFVLPSRFESFPRVLLEAMAAQLPIVATRVGGVAESVLEGRNALLVPPDDPPALAAAILELLDDPARRRRFAEESLRRAAEFDWRRIAPRYRSLFEGMIQAS
ncbi:MAG: glycosyltransferase family 4 protein [Thermoplasmata archaeon]